MRSIHQGGRNRTHFRLPDWPPSTEGCVPKREADKYRDKRVAQGLWVGGEKANISTTYQQQNVEKVIAPGSGVQHTENAPVCRLQDNFFTETIVKISKKNVRRQAFGHVGEETVSKRTGGE